MKIQNFIFLMPILFVSLQARAKETPPFQTKEPVLFSTAENDKLSDIGNPSEFIGVLTRENVQDPIHRHIDVYQFKKMSVLQLDKKKCHQIAESVVGSLKGISLQSSPVEVKQLKAVGKVCVLVLKDKDPQERMPERHLIVSILNLKVFAFVFKHAKSPAESKIESELQFIDSLR